MTCTKPLPAVGVKVRRDLGAFHAKTWQCWGEVRAVVDDEVIVVRRWIPVRRTHVYTLISRVEWEEMSSYRHEAKK